MVHGLVDRPAQSSVRFCASQGESCFDPTGGPGRRKFALGVSFVSRHVFYRRFCRKDPSGEQKSSTPSSAAVVSPSVNAELLSQAKNYLNDLENHSLAADGLQAAWNEFYDICTRASNSAVLPSAAERRRKTSPIACRKFGLSSLYVCRTFNWSPGPWPIRNMAVSRCSK